MAKRARVAAAVGLLAALTLLAFFTVNKDRLVEEWYLRRLDVGDETVQEVARSVLLELASVPAVPLLLRRGVEFRSGGDEGENPYHQCVRGILSRLDHGGFVRLARRLDEGNPQAFLRALLLHGDTKSPAAQRAYFLGASLESRNAGVRRYAAERLAHLGPDARRTTSRLEKVRWDPIPGVRFWAKIALRNLGESSTEDLFEER